MCAHDRGGSPIRDCAHDPASVLWSIVSAGATREMTSRAQRGRECFLHANIGLDGVRDRTDCTLFLARVVGDAHVMKGSRQWPGGGNSIDRAFLKVHRRSRAESIDREVQTVP